MTTNNLLFPAGDQLLGRVLNSSGEALDGQGALTGVSHVPLYSLALLPAVQSEANQFFESGIKVVDLFSPLARGGIYAVAANFGLGSMVLVEELLYNLIHRHNGCAVCLGLEDTEYTGGELFTLVKELDAQASVALLVERASTSPDRGLKLLASGLTVARELSQQGREVFLLLNKQLVSQVKAFQLPQLSAFARTMGVTTFLFSPVDEEFRRQEPQLRAQLDGCLLFNAELATLRNYPAVDPLLSSSRLLGSSFVHSQHSLISSAARDLLREGQQLRINSSLSPAQNLHLSRARKLQFFLSQPFFVAELFTEVPGEFVSLDETLNDVQALISGQYDLLPEQAFFFVGAAAQAQARAAQP